MIVASSDLMAIGEPFPMRSHGELANRHVEPCSEEYFFHAKEEEMAKENKPGERRAE